MWLFANDPPSKTLAPPSPLASPFADLTSTVLPVRRMLLIVPLNSPAPAEPSALPVEPTSVADETWLFAITSLLKVTLGFVCRPPENASALPTELVMVAVLPEIVVLLMATAAASSMLTPPACASMPTLLGSAAASVALLFVTELLLTLIVPPVMKMPPPVLWRPFGADADA